MPKDTSLQNATNLTDLELARNLTGLEDKWLQPFDVTDPFAGLRLEGYLSRKPNHLYGAVAILRVDEHSAPQLIHATPKLHYPFGKSGQFHFPPISKIDIFEKLDGTNVLAYRYKDADNNEHLTYKLRLYPVLRNGKWGAFLDMWREMLELYTDIPTLADKNDCAISFELYGARNLHLMTYENPLDCAVLFGVDRQGNCRPPFELDLGPVPSARHHGTLQADHDPVEEYARIRSELEAEISPAEEDRLNGLEGTVWYVTTPSLERVMFKCKPESVEAIHWKGGINKEAVKATCWNLLETQDDLSYAALEPMLLEEYDREDIGRFREMIDLCLADINLELEFRDQVLAQYKSIGVRLSQDKGKVMRHMSGKYEKRLMAKVYSTIKLHG
ncbi:MAG: hypothetical protein L3J67_00845 [Hyphomicrobiaceae bacterium]|nr:hypothetical protein [Hyphomicrobiaceae bacterium]